MKEDKLYVGEIYHIFNRSIAGFKIFSEDTDKLRFFQALVYYLSPNRQKSLSSFLNTGEKLDTSLLLLSKDSSVAKFIAYCIMPDHYHLVVKVLDSSAFSKYINNVENSYTRYFNIKKGRKGPLWEGRFKRKRVDTEEHLLHLTRYVHLNPTSNGLVKRPEEWKYSSYKEYIKKPEVLQEVLTELRINSPEAYKDFVDSQKDYQKKLKEIRRLLFEEIK